jgi:myosin heavy subunit
MLIVLKCTLNKFDGEKVTATLHESEVADCKGVPEFKKPGFPAAPENTLEYSKMAERGIDDMVEIDELNPATLLYNLSQKYKKDGIYCYVGPILLAMNPFKFIPALATPELMA